MRGSLKIAISCVTTALAANAQIPTGVTYEIFYDATQVNFNQPTFVGGVPGDPGQLIVVERRGSVHRLVRNGARHERRPWFTVDADIYTHWDGAWAVEFHPRFPAKPLFYVLYRQKTGAKSSVIEEWTCDPDLGNPRKVRDVIFFAQESIHSSGDIKFGPDGYLYSAQGDRDQRGLQGGQLMSELWGKVIRIDVDRKDPGLEYAIPDNPFKGQPGVRPEIWASGFRMPYRFNFDKLNGDLYLGDVGDASFEEVNLVQRGKNYGSGTVEGMCTNNCAGLTNPVAALPRGCVIGGMVYRNDPTSGFYGAYIFADYQSNRLSALRLNAAKDGIIEQRQISAPPPARISAMGQDAAGNFYVATYQEIPATSRTHIYRLAHADLRPAAVSAKVEARRETRPSPSATPEKLDAAGYRAYSLDGRSLSLRKSAGADLVLLRDARTGAVSKWVRMD